MVKIIRNKLQIPRELREVVEEIKKLMSIIKAIITHIYREGNSLADYLANLTIETESIQKFNNFHQLPPAGRKIINMDKMQISNLRIKITRIKSYSQSFWPSLDMQHADSEQQRNL